MVKAEEIQVAEVQSVTQDAQDAQEEPFSVRLRTATWAGHGDNEGSAYMTALMDGRLGREEYAVLLGQLYFVYDVLEQAADELASPFDFAELRRREALESDLRFFFGPGWAGRIEPNDATRRYLERLREVCFEWPAGFVAHHYTRYLGDLSGGQYIGRQVERTYGLTEDGVRFYRFAGKPKGFKDRYRALLDDAPWDEAERQRVIDEVKIAYRLNAEVTADLSRDLKIAPAA